MINRIKTNIHLDGEIAGSSPDAQYDLYKTSDAQRDLNYYTSKLLDMVSALNGTALTEVILNTNGGKVTDSGGGQVDISKLYGIGLAVDGGIRPVYIPALTNVSLPSGWDDGRAIWVIAKHEFLTTGSTRNHAKYPAETYHYQVIDSYYGNADSTLLFTDSSPAAGTLILGKFTMTGTVFADLAVRSAEVDVSINKLTTNDIVHKNYNLRDKIEMVKDYSFTGTTETGAIEIVLPPTWVYHMPKFVIRLRSNATPYVDCFIHISGHMHQTNRWNGVGLCSTEIFGKYEKTPIVKFGYRTSTDRPVLIIGDIADVWYSGQIQIESIHGGYADLPSNWLDRSNYSISIISSIADYTNQFDIIPSVYGNNAKVTGDLSAAGSISSATTRLATDLNLELGNELVRAELTTTNRPDASQYNVICVKFGANNNTQLAMEIDSAVISPRIWFRKRTASTWEAWYPIVTDTFNGTLTIDTGTSQGVLLPEDGGLEYLANAVESGGSYTRKYANSAFRIKPSLLADHKTYIDTAIDGTAGSAITWDNILTFDHVLKTISGAVENPVLTISYGTHVNITGVVVSIRSTMKINNTYIVEIGVSGTVTTTGLQTTIIIGFPGLTPVGGGGSVNGVIAGTTDQSLWTRRISNSFYIESPSINAAGALTAEGTIEFSI